MSILNFKKIAMVALVGLCVPCIANAKICFLPGDCESESFDKVHFSSNDDICHNLGYVTEAEKFVKVQYGFLCTESAEKAGCYSCVCQNEGNGKEVVGGRCQCQSDYPLTAPKETPYRCEKHAAAECYKCVCPTESGDFIEREGECLSDLCEDGAKYPVCSEGEEMVALPNRTEAGSMCFKCEASCQYRHAIAEDAMPYDSNGVPTSSPQNVIGKSWYEYSRLKNLHDHGDVYIRGGTPIMDVFNRIDKTSRMCQREGVTYYDKICSGEPRQVCQARGANYKFTSNGCQSESYTFAANTAKSAEWGTCTKNCGAGFYNTVEECQAAITNPEEYECVSDNGCYKIKKKSSNPSSGKAIVRAANMATWNQFSGGTHYNINVTGWGYGLCQVEVRLYMQGYGGTISLSRTETQIQPGTYQVCVQAQSGNWSNGSPNCAYGSIQGASVFNIRGLKAERVGGTERKCGSAAGNGVVGCNETLSDGCMSYYFGADKTYEISQYSEIWPINNYGGCSATPI